VEDGQMVHPVSTMIDGIRVLRSFAVVLVRDGPLPILPLTCSLEVTRGRIWSRPDLHGMKRWSLDKGPKPLVQG
jgi:hypothetical protein